MPRTKTPDGKRVGWSVKLSQPKSDAADALRGSTQRALWLESLIDQALAGGNGHAAATRAQEPPEARAEPAVPPRVPAEAHTPARTSARRAPKASGPVDEAAGLRADAAALSARAEATRALAEASGGALRVASDLPRRPLPETSPGTAVFMEPGSDAPVIPYESPDVPDHSGKKTRAATVCTHFVPRGTKCKICGPKP